MTTQSNKAKAGPNKNVVDAVIKQHLAEAAAKTEANETAVPESMKKFGKVIFDKAVNAAGGALSGVSATDAEVKKLTLQIEAKRQGNAGRLQALAAYCVELTRPDKDTADLVGASILMKDACEFAEQEYTAAFLKAHPAGDGRIQKLAPSWYAQRSQFIGMMAKAGINPGTFEKPTLAIDAYSAWKSNPDNADQRGPQGRKLGTRTADGAVVAEAITKTVNGLPADIRGQLATLAGTVQAVASDQHDKVRDILKRATVDLAALIPDTPVIGEAVTGTAKAPAQPARESAKH